MVQSKKGSGRGSEKAGKGGDHTEMEALAGGGRQRKGCDRGRTEDTGEKERAQQHWRPSSRSYLSIWHLKKKKKRT